MGEGNHDSIFYAEHDHVNPLDPTTWPQTSGLLASVQYPQGYTSPSRSSIFFTAYLKRLYSSRGGHLWEWVESLAYLPTGGANRLPFRTPYYLRIVSLISRFCGF